METSTYSPGLDGVIATKTKVSYLDVDIEQILVRGYDLIDLARNLRYPDVAYLVIYNELPDQEKAGRFCDALKANAEVPEEMYRLFELMPKETILMDALRTGVSFLAGYEEPGRLADTSREANLQKGIKLLACMPTITVNAYRALNRMDFVRPDPSLGYAENFLYMLKGERPDPQALEAFDRILTLYIEHEMPNSTFAARVIASTLSDIYGAVGGAVASLKGPLHGGANEAAAYMILDIMKQGGAAKAEEYTMGRLERKERIMGFGHRVYMKKADPRAVFLRDYIGAFAKRRPDGTELHAIYKRVEEVIYREKGLYPNTDYPIGLLFYLLDVPIPLYTPIFLCSRTAGLVAHVVEQHEDNRLFRPRVIYEGARGLKPPDKPICPC
jgi:citrate synthase